MNAVPLSLKMCYTIDGDEDSRFSFLCMGDVMVPQVAYPPFSTCILEALSLWLVHCLGIVHDKICNLDCFIFLVPCP